MFGCGEATTASSAEHGNAREDFVSRRILILEPGNPSQCNYPN
jgi:hypothetical protein